MKRKIFVTLAIIWLCALTAYATPVASTSYTYYDDGTMETMCIEYSADGIDWTELYSYSTVGAILKWESFDETGTLYDTVYTYDDDWNLLYYIYTEYCDDGTTRIDIYDGADNVLYHEREDGSTFSYSYNDSGVRISSDVQYADGSYAVYLYNDSGVRISGVEYTVEDGIEFVYTYNDSGALICEARYYDDGHYNIDYYDDDGVLTCSVYYRIETGIEVTETYDTDGNLLERTSVSISEENTDDADEAEETTIEEDEATETADTAEEETTVTETTGGIGIGKIVMIVAVLAVAVFGLLCLIGSKKKN